MGYYNYVEQMKDFIDSRLEKGINTFTHKDILNVTNTNCPYTTLRSLKNKYELESKDIIKLKPVKTEGEKIKYVKVKYREYTVIKRKENNVKKPSIWGKGKNDII